MTVYRVQDADGRGPYKPGFSHKWIDACNQGQNCPNVFDEFPGLFPLPAPKLNQAFGCAFLTVDALRRWFSPTELSILVSYGYNVVSMDVDTILAQSRHQCVFRRNKPLKQDVVILPTT